MAGISLSGSWLGDLGLLSGSILLAHSRLALHTPSHHRDVSVMSSNMAVSIAFYFFFDDY